MGARSHIFIGKDLITVDEIGNHRIVVCTENLSHGNRHGKSDGARYIVRRDVGTAELLESPRKAAHNALGGIHQRIVKIEEIVRVHE